MKEDMPFSIHRYLRETRGSQRSTSFVLPAKVKRYPRMPKMFLDEPSGSTMTLEDAFKNRRSFGHDDNFKLSHLSRSDISNMFGLALRVGPKGKRPYPSGGALYPIEAYFIGSIDNGVRVYHYNPRAHAFDDLWSLDDHLSIADITPGAEFCGPAYIVFTALWGRNGLKYGDFGYYLGMLEAGHAAQNILLASAALDIAARAMGGFNDALLTDILDLDDRFEQPVYVLTIGKKSL